MEDEEGERSADRTVADAVVSIQTIVGILPLNELAGAAQPPQIEVCLAEPISEIEPRIAGARRGGGDLFIVFAGFKPLEQHLRVPP